MRVLLTNDDSCSSPLLDTIIGLLKPRCELSVIVPRYEQSYKSKALTRVGSVRTEIIILHGHEATAVEGTPADCVQLGVHHLMPERPDLIVSGINVGFNAGTSFVFSSGTIGACFEANIARIPGIALSQSLDKLSHDIYQSEHKLSDQLQQHFKDQTIRLLSPFFDKFFAIKRHNLKPLTYNINLPFEAEPNAKIVTAPLSNSWYGNLFKKDGDGFVHSSSRLDLDPRPHSDMQVLTQNQATLTVLDIASFGQVHDHSATADLLAP